MLNARQENERDLWGAALAEQPEPVTGQTAGARLLLALCESSGARPDWFCHVCAKTIGRYGATIGALYVCEEHTAIAWAMVEGAQ